MRSLITAICVGSLLVMDAAHADVGREEALDAAVRQFAAKLESDWQSCLNGSETVKKWGSGRCAYLMLQTAKDAVTQKYREKFATAQDYANKDWLPKDVPAMLPKAQDAWEQYVREDCGVVAAQTTGTASTTYQLICEYKHQIQRLHALDEW
ncbi:lysozyme inhibitor LprI family protein [Pseudomonas kermanshahensis]|uniref:Lysozyme inhibitor LprI family protein n=1 Tax=Pseudomonas kermanshahensis TaxID=2745482 RepID=A0ABU8RCV9_9PSED|nr:DUF1311 domain-containing protein [Pseudomonas sp. SWRI50]MBC3496752.1 DUF1311 domain-containing protein [Pseudomonas sp. SWRI67]MBV4526187.1 DUF1311 domain-containing protein [Pseudomonas kermanshahensis]